MNRPSRALASLTGLLLLLASCAATRGAEAESAELTLLTYNIHHGRGDDGVIDLERQAAVILASGADLVALQEVDVATGRSGGVDQAAELARLTGMHYAFAEAMPYDGGSYGEAFLSRWPIQGAGTWPLPASPGHEPRAAVAVLVHPPGHARPLRLLGTHLDHTADQRERLAQVDELLAQVARTPADAAPPTVLLGDLNAEPGSEPMERFIAAGWRAADPDLAPTYPAAGPEVKIDWILLAPGSPGELSDVEVLVEPVASDHAPLRAVWRP
mgnify:CR=1 FL=1